MEHKLRLDDILVHRLGQFGFYQKFHYILFGIPVIFASMHALSWTFTAAKLNYRCLYPGENSTAPYKPETPWHNELDRLALGHGKCERISGIKLGDRLPNTNASVTFESCYDGYTYDHTDITYSAVERWGLVCHRSLIVPTVQALYFLGQFLGSIFFGLLSDKIGRKPVFIMGILVQLICGALLAVVPYLGLAIFLRFIIGFHTAAVFIMSVVLSAESVGPSYRKWSGIAAWFFWANGEVALGALAYPFRDYPYLQLVISLPAIFLLIYCWVLPESARWLLSQGKYDRATVLLNKMAEWNGKPVLPQNWYTQLNTDEPAKLSWCQAISVLFRTPRLRTGTLISFFLWAAVTVGYYGLAINPSFMGGDNRLGFILGGLMEIPGFVYVLFVNFLGRKFIAVSGFLVAALCLGLTLAVPSNYAIGSLLLVGIGKSAFMACFTLLYIWTPERYPTMVRSTATGACSMAARLGGILASFCSLKLANEYPQAVALTFCVLSTVAGVLCLFLPETAGEQLVETIEEAEDLGRGQPILIFGYMNQKMVEDRKCRKTIRVSNLKNGGEVCIPR